MKMTDADERAFAVLDAVSADIEQQGGRPDSMNVREHEQIKQAIEHLRARLAADQQKGGGECNCSGGRGAEHCVVHAPNGSLQAFDAITTPQPSIPAPTQQDSVPPGTPMMPSGAFHNVLWKTMPAELQPHGRMLTQLWSVADSTEMKNALETAILSMSAQQDGKASGGEVDDAMVERACIAYYEQPAWAFMSHKAACKDRMRAALTVALAHPPHADQETQG